MPDTREIADRIKHQALALGFDLCGIASVEPSARRDYYLDWIASGQHGSMRYLADRAPERLDPRVYFPPAKSVVCLAMNYYIRDDPDAGVAESASAAPGKIARYARGEDYHIHIKQRLCDLADFIRDSWPGAQTKIGVDTAPIMERELAARAGIGWQGKNSCIIHPRIGSWLFLAEIITSLDLPSEAPQTDHCGSCTRCIDACPTGAITAPYQLDARKCISYLTIEHVADIDPSLQKQMGDWLFGCDICQDVCPFNSRAPSALDPFLRPRLDAGTIDANEVLNWSQDDYFHATRKSAMRRVKLPIFQRNARIVLENGS